MNGKFNRRSTSTEMAFDDNTNRCSCDMGGGHNKQLVNEP